MTQLHYYRCTDCLSIATAEDYKPRAECSICSGKLEYLGRVQKARLVETREVCKCDGRCIFARGPNCDCACHGENHGSGWYGGGFETVDTDRGPVPRLRMVDDGKAAATATEWREAFAALRAAMDETRGVDWRRYGLLSATAFEAKRRRNHKNRMKLIGDALPTLSTIKRPELQAALF